MTKVIYSILIILYFIAGNCLLSYSQEADLSKSNDTLRFEGTIKVKDTPKSVLFMRAMNWMKIVYKNPDEVIKSKNGFKGYIIGNAIITYNPTDFSGSNMVKGIITYDIELRFEDNQYHYCLDNFVHTPLGGLQNEISFGLITTNSLYQYDLKGTTEKWRNFVWSDIRKHIKERQSLIVSHLEEHMKKSTTGK